jgi:ABC-type multidrug transport system ATPase subunit
VLEAINLSKRYDDHAALTDLNLTIAGGEVFCLLRVMSEAGVAVLMATHDLFRAKESGTCVGMMKHGRLIETLSTSDIVPLGSDLDFSANDSYLGHQPGLGARAVRAPCVHQRRHSRKNQDLTPSSFEYCLSFR